jgi:hypothetical protein
VLCRQVSEVQVEGYCIVKLTPDFVWVHNIRANLILVPWPVLYMNIRLKFVKFLKDSFVNMTNYSFKTYEGGSRSLRTSRLERGLQMVQLSATRCSCIAILWVSLVSFAAITLCIASKRVFIVVSVYFVIDSVRKLLDTPSYTFLSFLFWYGM